MKKNKIAQKVKSSKGFSLLEVLLAIVILGLIAAPILQLFLSSSKMNLKSREILGATDLANMTMEYITSLKFDGEGGALYEFTEHSTDNYERIPAIGYSCGCTTITPSGTCDTIELFTKEIQNNYSGMTGKMDYYYKSSSGEYLGVSLHNIDYNGKEYDMIIWFEATDNTDTFFTYDVTVDVYNDEERVNDEGVSYTANFANKIVSVNGAIANK